MNRRSQRATTVALSMLAPNFIGFLIFTAGPVVFSLIMAFTNWDLTVHNPLTHTPIKFIGLDNFRELLFGDEQIYFLPALKNTLYFMIGLPIGIALSLLGALMLNSDLPKTSGRRGLRTVIITVIVTLIGLLATIVLKASPITGFFVVLTGVIVLCGLLFGQSTFRALWYLPNLTAGVAMMLVWVTLYKPEGGPINNIIQPLLDHLTKTVHHTPAALWMGIGTFLILAAVAFTVLALISEMKKLWYRDTSFGGLVFCVLSVGALSLAICAIGYVITTLPHSVVTMHHDLLAPLWLQSPDYSKPAMMIMGLVAAMGSQTMLLYLAALSNVPQSLVEAASIDGASKWQTFWNVTWPQLAPTTFFCVIMGTIGGLQGGFEAARVMTGTNGATPGGPAGSTTTLAFYMYQRAFLDFRFGFASAIAWVTFAMIFIVTLIQWRSGNKYVND